MAFKSISVSPADYEEYEAISRQLMEELNLNKLSIAQVVRMAMTFYVENRPTIKTARHDNKHKVTP